MKKALAVTELVLILLAIGAGVGLIHLSQKSFKKIDCMVDVEACKGSFIIFKQIKEKVPVAPRINCVAVSPPNCEEKDLDGKKQLEVKHIIAENLRFCWQKTLGRENTMGEDFATAVLLGLIEIPRWVKEPDADFCLVCSDFIMPKDVRISADEWDNYLQTKKVKDLDKTYDDFVSPVGEEIWDKRYKGIDLEPGRHYYVVSVSAEKTKGDNQVYIYISDEVTCGEKLPQIHYQLR